MTIEEAKQSILTYCVEECGMIDSCALAVENECVEALAIKALEKQTPKKPKRLLHDGENDWIVCPNCGEYTIRSEEWGFNLKHCHNCGQAIDWSDYE